jgi:hypothetical protein
MSRDCSLCIAPLRSRYRADTFLNRCNLRVKGENLFHQNALHFRILVRAAIVDDDDAVVEELSHGQRVPLTLILLLVVGGDLAPVECVVRRDDE